MSRRVICSLLIIAVVIAWNAVCLAQAVPEEARRYLMRGMAAEEMAKAPTDYERAAREYAQAAKLAPNWPDIYAYMGSAQTKAGNYQGAMASYKRFLELAPNDPLAGKVRDELYKLEYRAEQQSKVADLGGPWDSAKGTFTVKVSGADFSARWRGPATGVELKWDGMLGPKMDFRGKGQSEEVFTGVMTDGVIKGTWRRAPYKEDKSGCTIPGDQSEFTGTVGDDGATIALKYVRSSYVAEYVAVFIGLENCTSVNKTGEMADQIVLIRTPKQTGKAVPDALKHFVADKNAGFVGITLAENDPRLVAGVAEGMPAAGAGIKAGDRILKVDGKDVSGMNAQQVVKLVSGKAGTKVTLEMERSGEAKPLTFDLVRKARQ